LKKGKARPKNVLAAFAVAPLGGAALVAAITLIFGVFSGYWDNAGGAVAAMLFVLASIMGYAVEIIAGIPGYLLFRHLAWVRRVHWITLGAVLGAASAAIWPLRVLLLNPDVDYGIAAVATLAFAGLLWGAASGLAFAWIIKVEPQRADEIASTPR
jgi:hypothetical protein